MKDIHIKAKKLRESGLSVSKIAKQMKISKSSASIWTRDVVLSHSAKEELKTNSSRSASAICSKRNQKCKAKRDKARKEGLEINLSDPLISAGLSLYWGEGNKNSGFTAITNGDPKLLLLFVKFLRERMMVQDDKIIVRITTHSEEQLKEQEPFWLNLLNLPSSNIRKGSVIKPGKKRTGKCLFGMCRLEVYDVILIEKILAGIEALSEFYI